MKSIRNYFSSPTKDANGITADSTIHYENLLDTSNNVTPYSPKIENSKSEITAVNGKTEASTKKHKKKSRKEKCRKPSDPAVKNIAQLFSNSLYLVSPEKSNSTEISKHLNDSLMLQGTIVPSCNEIDRITKFITEPNSPINMNPEVFCEVDVLNKSDKAGIDNSKQNAFKLMMDSRNKSIGMNSPGKEVMHDTFDTKIKKEKLTAQRNLLNDWAEQKGASKRKREAAQLDEVISHKLDKRARRLKTLLNIEDPLVEVDLRVPKKQSKRILHIPSSSGSDSDFEVELTGRKNKKINYISRNLNNKSKKENIEYIPSSVESENDVCEPLPVFEKAESSSSPKKIEKKSENDVFNSAKSKECSKSILSFFGVSSNLKNNCEVSDISDKTIIQGVPHKAEINVCDQEKYSKSSFMKKNEPVELLSDEDTSNKIDVISSKVCPKSCKNRRKKKKIENENCVDESSQDITLRRLRSWKIKINLSEINDKSHETDHGIERVDKMAAEAVESTIDASIGSAIDISSGSEDFCTEKKSKNRVKVAPVFTKSTPKPKDDPIVIEARKKFLMSGIPTMLKKVVDKEQSLTEREFVIFPTVSHVQQKCSNIFWDLPFPKLDLKKTLPFDTKHYDLRFRNLTKCSIIQKMNIQTEVEKIDKLKLLLNRIKRDNPDYPVYKSYRIISEKCGDKFKETEERKSRTKRGRGKKKQITSSGNTEYSVVEAEKNDVEFSMWTDKYKPRCSDDIIGNTEAIRNLKKWLVTWVNFSQEINSRKRRDDCSESEFESTDWDSRDSMALPGNTVVLGGPCGSGKSTAVYAICSELNINLIELNASSKRTGKTLLQKIQEATRSHQVRKKETRNFQNFFGDASKANSENLQSQTDKKMVVILIEDIDVVFEQDEGFIPALTHLITTSKRPIILTTTDYNSVFVQKFLSQYEYIPFLPLASYSLSTWLQILCLVEGIYIDKNDVVILLDCNDGDVRKTLLELQFWVKSGGQINRTEILIKMDHKRSSCGEQLVEDEQMHHLAFPDENNEDNIFMHRNCIKSFKLFEFQTPFIIPFYLNLGVLWWNIPNIIGIPDHSKARVDKFIEAIEAKEVPNMSRKMTGTEKKKFKSVTQFYDLLSFTDVMFRKVNYSDTAEPIVRNYGYTLSNSLELGEKYDSYDGNIDFVHELCHNLVNRFVKVHNRIDGGISKLNMSAPDRTERRWRAKQHHCADAFQDAISLSNHLERNSVSLDYIPALRNISRTEFIRAASNTKRGNRFRNYLRDLGLNRNSNVLTVACNILKDL
ncbi:unnamed protein product [Phaedon cochleariae]|uniref:ATPase AAA-type core domain-containing protein n=1 Tax=Phaedon cochleariae TaxID=80249 RepID=A0A9P0D8M7_PHACE|nr:unnamed protein product [Phaedon cochleariae]